MRVSRRVAPLLVGTVVVLAAAMVVLLLIRGDDDGKTPRHVAQPSPTLPVPDELPEGSAVEQALTVVPLGAEVVTVTDWDAIRARFGVPGLTSADLMGDRTAFWTKAEQEAVLLTDGLLLADNSELMLDHGFTQDDVDWEARWSGEAGSGYALRMRPDLDMAAVQDAVDAAVGELAGATVDADQHLVTEGTVEGLVWASDPTLVDLAAAPEETTYLHRGCLPLDEALGPDASFEDQDALLAQHDITNLAPLDAFAITYGDAIGTAWLGPDRDDLFERGDLVRDWPVTGSVGPLDAYAAEPAVEPTSGRLGFQVEDPQAAATLTLTGQLPFAVCNEVVPFDEPTGL